MPPCRARLGLVIHWYLYEIWILLKYSWSLDAEWIETILVYWDWMRHSFAAKRVRRSESQRAQFLKIFHENPVLRCREIDIACSSPLFIVSSSPWRCDSFLPQSLRSMKRIFSKCIFGLWKFESKKHTCEKKKSKQNSLRNCEFVNVERLISLVLGRVSSFQVFLEGLVPSFPNRCGLWNNFSQNLFFVSENSNRKFQNPLSSHICISERVLPISSSNSGLVFPFFHRAENAD